MCDTNSDSIEAAVRSLVEVHSSEYWTTQANRFNHFAYDDDDQWRKECGHWKYCECETVALMCLFSIQNFKYKIGEFEFEFQWNCFFVVQIRRKLKADIIDVKLLEETVQVLPVILLDYSKVLFELLDSFVRDKNPVISNFANVGYR